MEAANLAGLYDLPAMDWGPLEARLAAGLSQAPRAATALKTAPPGGATRWRF